ncbi:MAG TPA: choice-of-anchor Q domain-containing protein [Solirubrobacterales bacterium]
MRERKNREHARSHVLGLIGLGLLFAALWGATPPSMAAGGPYYAAGNGTGSACTEPSPCDIYAAAATAGSGETILLKADGGHFALPTPVGAYAGVTIRPAAAGQRPIFDAASGVGVFAYGTLIGVDLNSAGTGGGRALDVIGASAIADRVRVSIGGSTGYAVQLRDGGTLSDSTVVNPTVGGGAIVFGGSGGTARNVTALATGANSFGAYASGNFTASGTQADTIQNSILKGTQLDLHAQGDTPGEVVVSVDHSNYASRTSIPIDATITDLGGRQTAPPLFLNSASGDLHEASGSPTIDGGAAVAGLAAVDLDGAPRIQGAAADIGAYEFTASSPPSNAFTFGELRRNRRKGIAFLFVNLPGPGEIGVRGNGLNSISGAGVARASFAASGGIVKLKIAPAKRGKKARKIRRALLRVGRARVKALVTYLPTGGTANTQARRLKLIRRPSGRHRSSVPAARTGETESSTPAPAVGGGPSKEGQTRL